MLAPIPLLMLSALAEAGRLSENVAGAVGIAALLVLAAGAVAVFMSCGTASERYEYLEKEPIQAARSVIQMAREQQESSRKRYGRWNVVGVSLCILAALPLLIAAMLSESAVAVIAALCVTLALAGLGTTFLIRVGIRWESLQKLLEEGDYSREAKRRRHGHGSISAAFWLGTVSIYLAYSFITGDWRRSWIVWPVAGVLYAALAVALSGRRGR